MPVSTDNQDYKNPENQQKDKQSEGFDKQNSEETPEAKNDLSSDDLKGKKVDADLSKESDKPANI